MSEFFAHYREILSDPAHLAVEITLMLLVDGLLLGLLWPLAKKLIHRDIDRSHGHDHEKEKQDKIYYRKIVDGREVVFPKNWSGNNVRLHDSLAPVVGIRSSYGTDSPVGQGQAGHPERAHLEMVRGQQQATAMEGETRRAGVRFGLVIDPLSDRWALLMGFKPLKCKICLTRPMSADVQAEGPTHEVKMRWVCEDCGMWNESERTTDIRAT